MRSLAIAISLMLSSGGARPMKPLGIALALALVLASPSAAIVIEVPVAELTGTYSCAAFPATGCFQTITIHLPAIPSVIHSVSLRVHGTTSFASFCCEGPCSNPSPVHTNFLLTLYDPVPRGDYWYAEHTNAAAGEVAYTQPFEPGLFRDMAWSFLLDGTATLDFSILAIHPIPECNVLVGPLDSTTLDRVTLLVDGEFPTPAATSSWGRLKIIYR
jgi:hypothetical protein